MQYIYPAEVQCKVKQLIQKCLFKGDMSIKVMLALIQLTVVNFVIIIIIIYYNESMPKDNDEAPGYMIV